MENLIWGKKTLTQLKLYELVSLLNLLKIFKK